MNTIWRIGELARATGIEVETIRYYEKTGLLPPPARQANGYRAYAVAHLEQLAFIRHCRALDMSLADIRRLLDFLERPQADCDDINLLVDAQLLRVRARLASMQALERQLIELRGRCAQPHQVADCGILHELVAAAHGEACACHAPGTEPPVAQAPR
ncbi:Cd(II)/Pb(II)-responsive transcriptional regulator [Uliginosibacterium sp. 31-12]|uniref:Cd(II)/Pb(II)-responsive transcriptional regulator n=1 Tax=Uliginosibacterium sp. 31-12 TaxID=3062781 RepID=UPI0026E33D35|nr:Cd(II)/Pb(II)-responsive transcriptional regulator [Uliginosibacterium sp. 31-12]MDO6386393.1 Cd(II)/Pb(II)-responsive transcriptional regulator [Uliginosibacterium sp. 31-12]